MPKFLRLMTAFRYAGCCIRESLDFEGAMRHMYSLRASSLNSSSKVIPIFLSLDSHCSSSSFFATLARVTWLRSLPDMVGIVWLVEPKEKVRNWCTGFQKMPLSTFVAQATASSKTDLDKGFLSVS